MGKSKYLIEDFVEDTNACKTTDEAFLLYREAIGQYGFDSAVYTFVTDHIAANQKAGHGVKCNFPDDWMDHYSSNNYQEIDPVIEQVHRTPKAFSWTNLVKLEHLTDAQINILRQAEDAGLSNGVGIPLYGPRAELAGVGLAAKDGAEKIDNNLLSKLQLITEQFHIVYCSLGGPDTVPNVPHLTPKELEVIKWLTIGKTKEEIGIIIGCSESTVRFHIKNIFIKLDVTSKTQAVTKAIRLGLITYDIIKI